MIMVIVMDMDNAVVIGIVIAQVTFMIRVISISMKVTTPIATATYIDSQPQQCSNGNASSSLVCTYRYVYCMVVLPQDASLWQL